ncbi:MAG: hypothetical protein ACRDJL_01610 [Actinomycetota bacterium]
MLKAIAGFERRHGRWPNQKDFRSENDLPGYATVWRRFGSVRTAIRLAGPKEGRSGRPGSTKARRFPRRVFGDLSEIRRASQTQCRSPTSSWTGCRPRS